MFEGVVGGIVGRVVGGLVGGVVKGLVDEGVVKSIFSTYSITSSRTESKLELSFGDSSLPPLALLLRTILSSDNGSLSLSDGTVLSLAVSRVITTKRKQHFRTVDRIMATSGFTCKAFDAICGGLLSHGENVDRMSWCFDLEHHTKLLLLWCGVCCMVGFAWQ